MNKQRREDYRIVYPPQERPLALLKGGIFPILDLSATGMRIQFSGDVISFTLPEQIHRITIKFPHKEKEDRWKVEGKYLHHNDKELSFVFTKRLPLKKIVNEQFRLRKKYAAT